MTTPHQRFLNYLPILVDSLFPWRTKGHLQRCLLKDGFPPKTGHENPVKMMFWWERERNIAQYVWTVSSKDSCFLTIDEKLTALCWGTKMASKLFQNFFSLLLALVSGVSDTQSELSRINRGKKIWRAKTVPYNRQWSLRTIKQKILQSKPKQV